MKNSSIIIMLLLFIVSTSCEKKSESNTTIKNFKISLSKDEEPPLIFELKSRNNIQYFVENKQKKWNELNKDSEVTISVYKWKLFPHNNIEFEYPRNFSFEAELSVTEDIWTLSGNNFTIIVIRPIVFIDIESYVNDMITQFGSQNCSTKRVTKKINNSKLNGIKVSVVIAGVNIEIDVFEIIDKRGKKSLIVFQDTLSDSKENSEESQTAFERINQTFKIN